VLRSVIYDGWRHLFFVYPALLLVAVEGGLFAGRWITERVKGPAARRVVGAGAGLLVVLHAGSIAAFMIRSHPHEHVYFNALAGGARGARFRFDMDYWGLAYRAGLGAILRADRDPVIPVYGFDGPAEDNARALPYADRRRLIFVKSIEQAKYFIGNYRLRQDEYPYQDVVARITVDEAPILLVAAVDRRISMKPDTTPSVAPVRQRNAEFLAGLDEQHVRDGIETGIRTWLARFLRDARQLEIDIASDHPANLTEGHMSWLGLRIRDAHAGDFRRDRPGIPLQALDIDVEDLVLDVATPLASIRPALMGRLTIREFALDEQAINTALAAGDKRERLLRVNFQDGAIRVEYLGRPSVEITLRPRLGADPWKGSGDNLWFAVERIRVAGWRLPLTSLAQAVLNRYSPVIDPQKVDAAVELGGLEVSDGVFRMGTAVSGSAQ
jgi:hypothetical protein